MSGILEGENAASDVTTDEELKESPSASDARAPSLLTDAGAPSSVGQQPNVPEHNYDQQKGLAGALVLPPLPPLGTPSGKNPDPRPVKPNSKSGKPALGTQEIIAIPQAIRPQSRAVEAQTTREKPVETRTGQSPLPKLVRRLTQKPLLARRPTAPPPAPPQSFAARPSLPFGSTSERGTIAIVPSRGARLPLGTPTGSLDPAPLSRRNGKSDKATDKDTAKSKPSAGLLARAIGPLVRAKPAKAKPGSNEPSQPKQSLARRSIAALMGQPRREKPGANEEIEAKEGVEAEVDARAGAEQAVVEVQEAVAPVEAQEAAEKKARNSRGVKDGSLSPVPPTPLPDSDAELGDGSGLKGEYYLGRNFEQYEFTRADKNLDLFWGWDTSPSPKLTIAGDWSIRWTGKIAPKFSETYTLYAVADDGVRVWIDHKLIIDGWGAHPLLEYAADVKFEAGKQYDIRVDYFEGAGAPASIGLYWESSSQKKEFVPQDRLFYPLAGSKGDLEKDEKPQ